MDQSQTQEPVSNKKISKIIVRALLFFGILWMPYFFCWFTLTKKFSMKWKIFSFLWLLIVLIAVFIVIVFGGCRV